MNKSKKMLHICLLTYKLKYTCEDSAIYCNFFQLRQDGRNKIDIDNSSKGVLFVGLFNRSV